MADEQVSQTVENSQVADAASTSAEAQNNVANPPVAENATASPGSENRVPQQRFNEVITQRNRERELREQYESKIRELEARQPQDTSKSDALTKRLVEKLGMSPEAASEVVAVQREAARLERGDIEGRLRQYEVKSWSDSLAQKHKDYSQLLPEMEKVFNEMSDQEQMHTMASPKSLEMFYKAVRADSMEKQLQGKFNEGANAAYQNKATKVGMSSLPGQSNSQQQTAISRESIAKMSSAEYQKRLPEINAWLESKYKPR